MTLCRGSHEPPELDASRGLCRCPVCKMGSPAIPRPRELLAGKAWMVRAHRAAIREALMR